MHPHVDSGVVVAMPMDVAFYYCSRLMILIFELWLAGVRAKKSSIFEDASGGRCVCCRTDRVRNAG